MPAYNVAPFIRVAINSVLGQSYTDFELLISDDASKDNTVSIIKEFSDPRIQLHINSENLGYAENMNILFNATKGDYIILQDSDDYCTHDRLELLCKHLDENPKVDIVGSSYIKFDNSGKEEINKVNTDLSYIKKAFDEMSNPLPVLNGSVMLRRKIVEDRVLFRNLKYINRSQDDDWLLRISEKFTFSNVSEILYYYRTNFSSMTLNPSNINKYSYFAVDFVHFLKKKRMEEGIDYLDNEKWKEIDNFFTEQQNMVIKNNPSFFESYIAHKYLALRYRGTALQWFLKAILKDPFNSFLWKKMILVLSNKY
jgi:glycosyltransferase involved in cell wall biosynthesis